MFRGHFLGRHYEVALVLAVLVVNHYHKLSVAERLYRLFYCIKLYIFHISVFNLFQGLLGRPDSFLCFRGPRPKLSAGR